MLAVSKRMGRKGILWQGMDYFEAMPVIHGQLRMLMLEAREVWIKLWLAQGNLPPVAEGKDSAIFYRNQPSNGFQQVTAARPLNPKSSS